MTKILFPFELDNPLYKEAYIFALKFARNLNAELVVLNVFKIDADERIAKEVQDKLVKQKRVSAYKEISKFNKYYQEHYVKIDSGLNIRFDYRFVQGKLLDEIKEILKEELIDLVILPITDKKEINKKQLEIMRDDIFEKNRASLLIVPFNFSYKPISKIVFATDLERLNFYELYLKDIVKYARIFKSSIHFLHISENENIMLPKDAIAFKRIKHIIMNDKKHIFESIYGKNIVRSILKYILQNNADLLVVVKHERFFLDSLIHKSASDEISLHSKIPVLVMREKKELGILLQ